MMKFLCITVYVLFFIELTLQQETGKDESEGEITTEELMLAIESLNNVFNASGFPEGLGEYQLQLTDMIISYLRNDEGVKVALQTLKERLMKILDAKLNHRNTINDDEYIQIEDE